MRPYGLCADLHFHQWSAFATTTAEGLNSRLAGLIGELMRCCEATRDAGGDTVVLAGDIFHVRGSVAPTVLNSALDAMGLCAKHFGTKFIVLAGNHDLEGKDSTRLGSAVTALEGVPALIVNHRVHADGKILIPWFDSIEKLKAEIADVQTTLTPEEIAEIDLILHAPIDGVIDGLPAHGLTPEWLASLGFKRVFAGHYHNHKEFACGVYSIGALAHHTWSDIKTRAGFLIVGPDRGEVTWRKSHLPQFIDLAALTEVPPEDIPLIVEGNYVRVKVESSKVKDVEGAAAELKAHGALGVVVQIIPAAPTREGSVSATVESGASLEASIGAFVKTLAMTGVSPEVDEATRKLAEVRAGEVLKEALSVLSDASMLEV